MRLREYLMDVYVRERTLAATTKRQYQITVNLFYKFCEQFGLSTRLDELSHEHLNLWRDENPRQWAPKTMRRRIDDIAGIWKHAYRTGVTDNRPDVYRIGRVRVPKKIPVAWTTDELDSMLTALENEPYFARYLINGVRRSSALKAVIYVGFYSALRPSDLLGLKLWQIKEHSAVNQAKKNTEILISIPQWTVDFIQREYPSSVTDLWEFSSEHFYDLWKRLLPAAGLPSGATEGLQKLRRTAVSYGERVRLGYGSQLAGHDNPRTTRNHYDDPRISRPDSTELPDISSRMDRETKEDQQIFKFPW